MSSRYYVRSPQGETITGYGSSGSAEKAALELGEGAHLVDVQAPAYTPMIQQVIDGALQIMGVGGWGANRLGLEQNFLQAIKRKHLAIVHAFFACGANPGACDEEGRPAIIWAVASGRLEIVKFLLEKGADPSVADPEGETALSLATQRQQLEMISVLKQALLNAGGDKQKA